MDLVPRPPLCACISWDAPACQVAAALGAPRQVSLTKADDRKLGEWQASGTGGGKPGEGLVAVVWGRLAVSGQGCHRAVLPLSLAERPRSECENEQINLA